MAEWRYLRPWTEAQLEKRLDALDTLSRSFEETQSRMTPERGWTRFHSTALIAREIPGVPVVDGPFLRARPLVSRYEFSDPRIVTAHFDAHAPLAGRRMLLELKVMGLRYLMGTVVDAVLDETHLERSVFGFRYSTLSGHMETGSEWFLVEKEHSTGWVRFSIEAFWRLGEMPNWWSELGFRMLSPTYQRAWHRLSYLRLRRMLGATGLPALPRGRRLLHSGAPVPAPSVYRTALGTAALHGGVETEEPGRRGIKRLTPVRATELGVIAGMRSALAPALASRYLAQRHPDTTLLSSRRVARLLRWLAASEMLADKAPFMPDRTRAPALVGRLLAAAFAATALSPRRRPRWRLALCAAGAAVASTFVTHRVRQALPLPNAVAGALEDVLALVMGRRVLS